MQTRIYTISSHAEDSAGYKPMHDERLLDRSMMARLLGLLSSDRFASEMSAVTRVIVILSNRNSLSIHTLSPVILKLPMSSSQLIIVNIQNFI